MSSSRSALIIVDVQNDFLPSGSLAVPSGDDVIAVINRIVSSTHFAGGVYMSKDWHPPNHTSFASNHTGAKPFQNAVIDMDGAPYQQTLWPDHCVQHTHGAQFAPALLIADNAVTILKGMDARYDSYSAFFDNARKTQTQLDSKLRQHNVGTLYVCGLALDVCVLFTVMDAIALGYHTVLISDACRGLSAASSAQAISKMKAAGASITTAAELQQQQQQQV